MFVATVIGRMDQMPAAVVLGSGMVGSVMAADLGRDDGWSVTIVDRNEAALAAAVERAKRYGATISTATADLSDSTAIKHVIADADVVCGALASHLGLNALRAVIESRKPYCDISFMADDPLQLDALAREHGVTAVVDCGVAPGMSNMLSGYATVALDEVDALEIYVGGLPVERRLPFQYKAGFAPADVLEEYTRPSRIVEAGRTVVREALTELEPIEFDGLGTLEAFNTDGLRSLVDTLDIPNMKEKTLRYPGHVAIMLAFREAGLFSTDLINVNGQTVRPLDVTSHLLFPKWTFEPDEPDVTVMRVLAHGRRDGRAMRLEWDLRDDFDPETKTTSMGRTTAFPCTIVARLLASGAYEQPGVIPPERLGQADGILDSVLEALQLRGVRYCAREVAS